MKKLLCCCLLALVYLVNCNYAQKGERFESEETAVIMISQDIREKYKDVDLNDIATAYINAELHTDYESNKWHSYSLGKEDTIDIYILDKDNPFNIEEIIASYESIDMLMVDTHANRNGLRMYHDEYVTEDILAQYDSIDSIHSETVILFTGCYLAQTGFDNQLEEWLGKDIISADDYVNFKNDWNELETDIYGGFE